MGGALLARAALSLPPMGGTLLAPAARSLPPAATALARRGGSLSLSRGRSADSPGVIRQLMGRNRIRGSQQLPSADTPNHGHTRVYPAPGGYRMPTTTLRPTGHRIPTTTLLPDQNSSVSMKGSVVLRDAADFLGVPQEAIFQGFVVNLPSSGATRQESRLVWWWLQISSSTSQDGTPCPVPQQSFPLLQRTSPAMCQHSRLITGVFLSATPADSENNATAEVQTPVWYQNHPAQWQAHAETDEETQTSLQCSNPCLQTQTTQGTKSSN